MKPITQVDQNASDCHVASRLNEFPGDPFGVSVRSFVHPGLLERGGDPVAVLDQADGGGGGLTRDPRSSPGPDCVHKVLELSLKRVGRSGRPALYRRAGDLVLESTWAGVRVTESPCPSWTVRVPSVPDKPSADCRADGSGTS